MIGLSHFDCFYVVYEVPTRLSGHFERYFNIVDGSAYARGVIKGTHALYLRYSACGQVQCLAVRAQYPGTVYPFDV